ncbi:MAG TPA: hypothetical protein VMV31_00520 [Terriglobales bacterium]|nr:hypothetical protein [Terriglobales bacterium]
MTPDPIPALVPGLCPPRVLGAGALGKLVFDGADPAHLQAWLAQHTLPSDPATLYDLGLIHLYAGRRDQALALQAQALGSQSLFRVVGLQPPPPPRLRLLALVAPGDLMVNTPLEFILTGSDVSLDLLYLRPGAPLPAQIPDHDLAFTAVAQSDDNDAVLERLIPLVRAWPRPVVNDPDQLLRLSREQVGLLLRGAPGIAIPPTRRLARAAVAAWAQAGADSAPALPFIIRPVGSHAGHGLAKIASLAELPPYLAGHPADAEFYAAPFVDYQNSDGQFRKYRIVFIDRQPFLCHLAIARNWMVHYVGADMATEARNRAEEERAMASFDQDFARRHAGAFAALHQRFGLDYFGIDCAETREGELLIFEVASAMVIHAMDSPQLYPYKQAQMSKTFGAFHRLLEALAAARHPTPPPGTYLAAAPEAAPCR